MATDRKKEYVPKERGSAEDRALDKFTELINEIINKLTKAEKSRAQWKCYAWPRNLNRKNFTSSEKFFHLLRRNIPYVSTEQMELSA